MTEPTHEDIVDLARTLGHIDGRLSVFIDEFQREREGASAHRRDLRDVIGALSGAVRTLTGEVREMKPLVETMRDERSQAIGAARLRRALLASLATLFGLIGAGLLELIKAAFGRH